MGDLCKKLFQEIFSLNYRNAKDGFEQKKNFNSLAASLWRKKETRFLNDLFHIRMAKMLKVDHNNFFSEKIITKEQKIVF